MFVLLNLIVGLIISLYGLNIYPLEEVRAIEWTVVTILLLTAASTVVLVRFYTWKFTRLDCKCWIGNVLYGFIPSITSTKYSI